MSRLSKHIILVACLALPMFVAAQQPTEHKVTAPPKATASPAATDVPTAPDPNRAPPAEVPRRTDLGDIGDTEGTLGEGYKALGNWDLVAADRAAEKLKAEGKADSQEAMVFLFRLAFFHGDYAKARDILEKLKPIMGDHAEAASFDRVKNLADVMQGALQFESEHFIVRVTPGPDEILAQDTLRTLEKAYGPLTSDLKIKPTGKVVVEIFPSFKAFNWATGLSEKDVETSGTIAVCKYSRLMITSPRVLLYGYTWRDTLSHEFVHYLVFLRSGYNAPIWLHEGIARYEEERWRLPEGGYLSPLSQSLLASALAKNDLVTFDQMEPSFAMLPSAMHGALAFSEVSMAVKYMVSRGGFDVVLNILTKLETNSDYKKAIKDVLGEPYETFQRKWIAWMKTQPLKKVEGVEWVGLKFKKNDAETEDNLQEIHSRKESPEYKFERLGDLLRTQGKYEAAFIEYKKALKTSSTSPDLLNKTAHMSMMVGDHDTAEQLLLKCDAMNPLVYPSVYKRLGIISMARKDWTTARVRLETSADINPFDPELQSALMAVYKELGEKALEEETKQKIAILTGQRSPL